jgi:hypothetical protein
MKNVPSNFDEATLKAKISEKIYSHINEKENQMGGQDFKKWKEKCLKFKKEFEKASLENEEDIEKFQTDWKKKNKN